MFFAGIVNLTVVLAQFAGNGWSVHKKETLFHKPRTRANQKADMNEQERKLNKMAGIVESVDSDAVLLASCVALVAHLLHVSSSAIERKVW